MQPNVQPLHMWLGYNPGMRYEVQKRIQGELDSRIPRGPRRSRQNELRLYFNMFRLAGHSFDASLEMALSEVRKWEPAFTPRVLPIFDN